VTPAVHHAGVPGIRFADEPMPPAIVGGLAGARHRTVVPMLESQREPVPFNDDDETDTALALLSFSRSCVLRKLEGLDEEKLRRRRRPPVRGCQHGHDGP
jgi:hypothetical protein